MEKNMNNVLCWIVCTHLHEEVPKQKARERLKAAEEQRDSASLKSAIEDSRYRVRDLDYLFEFLLIH